MGWYLLQLLKLHTQCASTNPFCNLTKSLAYHSPSRQMIFFTCCCIQFQFRSKPENHCSCCGNTSLSEIVGFLRNLRIFENVCTFGEKIVLSRSKKIKYFLIFVMVFLMFFFFLWLYRFWCDVVQCANSTVVTAPLSPHFHRKDALVCRNMIHSTLRLVLYGIVKYLGMVSFQ